MRIVAGQFRFMHQRHYLSVGIVRARDDSCNNARLRRRGRVPGRAGYDSGSHFA